MTTFTSIGIVTFTASNSLLCCSHGMEDCLDLYKCLCLSSMANWTDWNRHVVLPPEVAKLLPKSRLLSEVRYLFFVVFNLCLLILLQREVLSSCFVL